VVGPPDGGHSLSQAQCLSSKMIVAFPPVLGSLTGLMRAVSPHTKINYASEWVEVRAERHMQSQTQTLLDSCQLSRIQ